MLLRIFTPLIYHSHLPLAFAAHKRYTVSGMGKKQTKILGAHRARVRTGIKLAVVPHPGNQHRPHLIRRFGIALILVGVFLVQGVYNTTISGTVLGTQIDLTAHNLTKATNAARTAEGLQPLALNDHLNKAAALKAEDMFAKQYWAHVSPDGTTPWYWFEKGEYQYAEAGENLAKNFSTSQGVVSAWMTSPGHRENVLKKTYTDVGFASQSGELNGEYVTIVVALYASPQNQSTQGVLHTAAPIVGTPISPITQLGLALTSMTPAAIASLVLLLFATNVALVAHAYRHKLPAALQKTWYRHHGAYKALLFVVAATVLVVAYTSTGQI